MRKKSWNYEIISQKYQISQNYEKASVQAFGLEVSVAYNYANDAKSGWKGKKKKF